MAAIKLNLSSSPLQSNLLKLVSMINEPSISVEKRPRPSDTSSPSTSYATRLLRSDNPDEVQNGLKMLR